MTRCCGIPSRTALDPPGPVPAAGWRPATSRLCERRDRTVPARLPSRLRASAQPPATSLCGERPDPIAQLPARRPRSDPGQARPPAKILCYAGPVRAAPGLLTSSARTQGRPPARTRCGADRDRTALVRPPRPVPDPVRPPARTRCGERLGRAALDRLSSLVPVLPARSRCSAGPGRTALGRPPSADPVRGLRGLRGPLPARIRCCGGQPGTVPARTGPARIVLARSGRYPADRPTRIRLARTRPARIRWSGTGQARRPGAPPRTSAGEARTLADRAGRAGRAGSARSAAPPAVVRTGRAAVDRVRWGRPRRRTGLGPGEAIQPQTPARSPALTTTPGQPGRTGLLRARSTAASSAGPAARVCQPGRPALGRGRLPAGRPASGRSPFHQRRTPQVAGRAGE